MNRTRKLEALSNTLNISLRVDGYSGAECPRDHCKRSFNVPPRTGLKSFSASPVPIRNKTSDGHALTRKPEAHRARIIVNSATTVAAFLVESYLVRRERVPLSALSTTDTAR